MQKISCALGLFVLLHGLPCHPNEKDYSNAKRTTVVGCLSQNREELIDYIKKNEPKEKESDYWFLSVTIKLRGVEETMKFRTERDIPHESIPCAIKGEYDECWIIKYDDALGGK